MKSDSEKRQKHKKSEVLGGAGMRMGYHSEKVSPEDPGSSGGMRMGYHSEKANPPEEKVSVEAVAACAWVIIQKKQILHKMKVSVEAVAACAWVIIQKKQILHKMKVSVEAVAACAWVIIQKKQIQVSTPNVYIKNQKKIE